jgi:hypothetical protein
LKLMVIAGNRPWWLIDSGWIGVVVHLAKGRQRDLAARRRGSQEDLVEGRGIALQRRQHLHDHVVAGKLREILRDLALGRRRRRA